MQKFLPQKKDIIEIFSRARIHDKAVIKGSVKISNPERISGNAQKGQTTSFYDGDFPYGVLLVNSFLHCHFLLLRQSSAISILQQRPNINLFNISILSKFNLLSLYTTKLMDIPDMCLSYPNT